MIHLKFRAGAMLAVSVLAIAACGSDDGGEGNDERASGVLNVAIPPLWKASGVRSSWDTA